MRSEKEIKKLITKLENDYVHILKGDFATITINAPRALLQLSTTAKLEALYFALGEKRPQYEYERNMRDNA